MTGWDISYLILLVVSAIIISIEIIYLYKQICWRDKELRHIKRLELELEKKIKEFNDKGELVMRITEKKENGFYELTKGNEIYGEENGIRLVQFLGGLEDFGDKLGISWAILLNAINSGFYKIDNRGGIIFISPMPRVDFKNKCFNTSSYYKLYFKDYGKTWALTKEELL